MFSLLSSVVPKIYPQMVRTFMTGSINSPKRPLLSNFLTQNAGTDNSLKQSNLWSLDFVRNNVIIKFPYPRETKRVKTHGWKKRMSTPSGRAVLMRRILKGRHVLSH